jgi:hypothetical protein
MFRISLATWAALTAVWMRMYAFTSSANAPLLVVPWEWGSGILLGAVKFRSG